MKQSKRVEKINHDKKIASPEQISSVRPDATLLETLFMAQLKDIYLVEERLMELLPRIKQGCSTEELNNAFELHNHQTEKQAKRLEKIFSMLKKLPETIMPEGKL